MNKLGGDTPPTWLIPVLLIILCIALSVAYRVSAQAALPAQAYMVIRHGYDGYDFDCVDQYPYQDTRPMDWNSTDGFTEVDAYDFVESIIAVENCNIDNMYITDDGNLFVWRMSDIEREGARYAIHVNRGAWWVVPGF